MSKPLRVLSGLAVAFLMLQLARPGLTNPPATAEWQGPAEVKQIFQHSCYPCHSNERRLSWFDEIVPAYWLVAHDIRKARAHLNFSELGAKPPAAQRAALFQAVNFVGKGLMPLPSYKSLHPGSEVTAAQLAVLQRYLTPKGLVTSSAKEIETAENEYRQWTANSGKPMVVQPAPNGIAFLPDYKDWKVIDSTARFDANTLRMILGNNIAIKAIEENNTNPWPDGSAFAKVGWHQQPDEHGILRAGAFLKVGFMIKDKTKYASTAGWGWAEWEGTELKPYGDGPDFARECVTCHMPQRNNDFVYTFPIPRVGVQR